MTKKEIELTKWLDKARKDVITFQIMGQEVFTLDIALFHAQQAVEKWLKTLVLLNGLIVVKTHDIKELLISLETFYPDIISETTENYAEVLNNYAVSGRYPDEDTTEEDYQNDLIIGTEALAFFETFTQSKVNPEIWR